MLRNHEMFQNKTRKIKMFSANTFVQCSTNKQNNIIVSEANNLERNVKYIFELKKK